MNLPRRLFAIAILVLGMLLFSAMSSPPVSAGASSVQAKADQTGTVSSTKVDAHTVIAVEHQTSRAWVRESVGKLLLNETVRIFEPVNELAGYRQKVATKPKESTYTGMGNTRAREQV